MDTMSTIQTILMCMGVAVIVAPMLVVVYIFIHDWLFERRMSKEELERELAKFRKVSDQRQKFLKEKYELEREKVAKKGEKE